MVTSSANLYSNDCLTKVSASWGVRSPASHQNANPMAYDEKVAKALWEASEKAVGEEFASFASALADETTFSQIGASGHDPFPLLAALTSQVLPSSCHPTTVFAAEGLIPTAGVLLHLILPHSLRCPADAYLTQVAMHHPHLHRSSGHGVAYGHCEEPPLQIQKSRLPVDMQGHEYKLSGYRLVHWDPTLKPPKGQNHMDLATRHTALTVAAVLSYYTARSIRLDNESSKLLLLTPHNDSVVDLQKLSAYRLQTTLLRSMIFISPSFTNSISCPPTLPSSHDVTTTTHVTSFQISMRSRLWKFTTTSRLMLMS